MRVLLGVLVLAGLVGCAPTVLSTSPRTVVIHGPRNAFAPVQALADAECTKHGRFAKMVQRPSTDPNQFMFDCVE